MKHYLFVFALAVLSLVANAQSPNDMPPNPQPGKCYAKCLIPEQYETVTQQILLKEASSKFEVVPAVYENVTEQLLVKEAYKVIEVVPATFSTVTEQVMVKEAGKQLELVPPTFETVSEQVLVSPATTKWTRGNATQACLQKNPDDCKVWCYVEVPAQYKNVTRQVLKAPANTREIPIPAEYKTITKAVVGTPATTREREVPAEYRTITKSVLKSPATTRDIQIPAEYSTVTTKKLVSPGGLSEWVEVMCESKITPQRISAIQSALKARGYDPGPIDNSLGTRTKQALEKFQKDNNLPVGNLNEPTLKALGIN